MTSVEGEGRSGQRPPLTREEFDHLCRLTDAGQPAEADLIERHNTGLLDPVSDVNLWRMERLEATALRWTEETGHRPAWADQEKDFYVRKLADLLRFIHNQRWKHALSAEDSAMILPADGEVGGYPVAYTGLPEKLRGVEKRPTGVEALSAIRAVMHAVAEVRPDLQEKLVQRLFRPMGRYGDRDAGHRR